VTGSALAASRLSFFSLCIYAPNSWGAAASDFYVYYPERTSRLKVFVLTLGGLWLSFSFVYLVAVGLATGVVTNPAWAEANSVSTGALIVAGYDPLSGFGKFCAVVVALGVIANIIPGTYSAALGCQVLGRHGKAVPRWLWSTILIITQLVLASAGREHLSAILSNFLALMGYWLMMMICIVAQEHVLFKRNTGYDWSRWEDQSYLPVGWAALASFVLGWVGAVLGMSQVWYVGPLAKLASQADIGMWVGCGISLLAFPFLRSLELYTIGR
jgi:purine-cytosine permease-like protein